MIPAETVTLGLSVGILAMQAAGLALLALFFLRKKFSNLAGVATFLHKWGLWIGLALTLGGALLTLYYSEIVGFPPCPLCWWQRAFLYPQVILFALALWKRDWAVADYSIALSLAGLGIGLYHHALQMFPEGALPCPALGTVSCAQRFVFEFGFITFPLMSATLFAFLIVVMLFVRKRSI